MTTTDILLLCTHAPVSSMSRIVCCKGAPKPNIIPNHSHMWRLARQNPMQFPIHHHDEKINIVHVCVGGETNRHARVCVCVCVCVSLSLDSPSRLVVCRATISLYV